MEPARKLGRYAVSRGVETLELARAHERALVALIAVNASSITSDGILKRAAAFFVEVLTPIENTHRAALEINGRLNQLNVTMRRQAGDLAATNRRMKSEIVRRRSVENALKQGGRHYDQLLRKSRQMQEQLRHLSHKILSAQEDERRRISRELHDEIGQSLTAINVLLATLTNETAANAKELRKKIVNTQRLVEHSMKTVHQFARELRPPLLDDLGLIPALHAHLKLFTEQTHIAVRFKAFAKVENLNSERRTTLYRVAQEALTNVAKHAHASRVTLGIRQLPGAVLMEIDDNGRSFKVERVLSARRVKRLGLIGMRERVEMVGGTFAVTSAPGNGTTVRAEIPDGSLVKRRPARSGSGS